MTASMSCSFSQSRIHSAEYPLSPANFSGCSGQAVASSMSGTNCWVSCSCPGVTVTANGVPTPSQIKCNFVLKPPWLRPRAWSSGSPVGRFFFRGSRSRLVSPDHAAVDGKQFPIDVCVVHLAGLQAPQNPVPKTGSDMRGPSWNRWASKLVATPVADFRFGGAVEFLVHLFHFRTLALRLPPSPGDGGRRYDHDQEAHGPAALAVGNVVLNDQRQRQQADHVHHFDERVDRRPGGIFERIADGVARDAGLMSFRAFAGQPGAGLVFDGLLGVVPGAAGVGHEDCQELADHDHASQEPAQPIRTQEETDEDGRENSQQAGTYELLLGRRRADIDHPAVVWFLGAGPDFLVAELHAAFLHDQISGPAYRPDGHAAEQEGHGSADQHADEND